MAGLVSVQAAVKRPPSSEGDPLLDSGLFCASGRRADPRGQSSGRWWALW